MVIPVVIDNENLEHTQQIKAAEKKRNGTYRKVCMKWHGT